MILILIILLTLYVATILLLSYGFTKVKRYENRGFKPKTEFTIVVPFRDEANHLPILLESIAQLNYPTDLFQVLLVDDESKNEFHLQNTAFQVRIIDNIRVSNSPKKDAIVTAMHQVSTDWIITTDADCVVPKNWLFTLDNYIQTHDVSMVAGAVNYDANNSFIQQFQQLDMASLQGATIGSFGIGKGFMCNGANLAYTKSLFEELRGFEGNDGMASGDDVFLLQKAIAKTPKQVSYLKSTNTIVTTKPLENWTALLHQRVRWASKTSSYQSNFGKLLAVVVLAGNLCWILTLVYWIFNWNEALYSLLFLLLKMGIDAVLILQSNRFLNTKKVSYLVLSSFFYPFFSVSVALFSIFGQYKWKGRVFSK